MIIEDDDIDEEVDEDDDIDVWRYKLCVLIWLNIELIITEYECYYSWN